MSRYCCFFCPEHDFSERSLEDECPSCGRPFGYPLFNQPAQIGRYEVIRPLDRGFYAATYLVRRTGLLSTQTALKVSPKEFYRYFESKDFEYECRKHEEVAAGTDHIVQIRDVGESNIEFSDESMDCYYVELDYEEGPTLSDYLRGAEQVSAQMVAQISIDLLRLKQELQNKEVYHNDLHASNIIIKRLAPDQYRANAIDRSIRAVAIDLGSVLDYSKSDSNESRYGDLHWICDHIDKLIEGLLSVPENTDDLGYRLASALQLVLQLIAADVEKQRTPNVEDLIEQIEEGYLRLPRHPWRPWIQPLRLRGFGASYNAQTLQPWHVPLLLVDQGHEWLNQITTPGPQVVVGMRGCGKTLFLRALQFHARASKIEDKESNEAVISRVIEDDFLGLFVSSQRLLDTPSRQQGEDMDPFPRLYIAYALEAVRALIHLQDIAPDHVADVGHRNLATTVCSFLSGAEDLENTFSLEELDLQLDKLLVRISRGDSQHELLSSPADAFVHLAEALRRSASCWVNVQVLYLLDDVSTRYLQEPRIRQLLSTLIFQHPNCAFKMTSEIQTMELGLTTPGENLLARVGRDLSVFDLGSEVYRRIKSRQGKEFVEEILSRRAGQFAGHPSIRPSNVLGDCNLQTIAIEIASSKDTSRKRKQVYRGINALAQVCVGDIGDVISLYERILRTANGKYPVPANVQSECFQDHCSHRLYDLNRRGPELKDVAKSFAEASHVLLVKSYRDSRKKDPKKVRIRQYASLYVRVTTGDKGRQIERLRDLIDAGVFVFAGGHPRSKTRDSDPMLQFKLTFRRIYGLVNFIGLSERDRFELSGSELEEWLVDPSNGKEILLRNLGGDLDPEDDEEWLDESTDPSTAEPLSLFGSLEPSLREESEDNDVLESVPRVEEDLVVEELDEATMTGRRMGGLVVGLGFEERTLYSAARLKNVINPEKVHFVQYEEPGKGGEILEVMKEWAAKSSSISYSDICMDSFGDTVDPLLIDITGLAKPVIFYAVHQGLQKHRSVIVAHTEARTYYPTNQDLSQLVQAQEAHDRHEFFETIANIMTGEERPYELVPLVYSDADQTRRRVLFAFASPKHERLLSLLDQREFDRLELIAPDGETPRNRVAKEIANIAAADNSNSSIEFINSDDVAKTTQHLLQGFSECYVERGMNFEIGLTGSKMETVAAAAVSAIRKITQCWYVRPQSFDPERFTKGAGKVRYIRVSIQ